MGERKGGKPYEASSHFEFLQFSEKQNFFASFFWGTGIFCAGHPSFLSRLVASAAADTMCLAAVKDDEGTAVLSFGDCVKSRRWRKKKTFSLPFLT